jgi:hypothetical protein
MPNKPFFVLIPLLLVGVPAAMLVSADWSSMFDKSGSVPTVAIHGPSGGAAEPSVSPGSLAASSQPADATGRNGVQPGRGPTGSSPAGDQVQCQDLAEVLRFEVTAAWILGRWPSVSTGLSQLDLQGYRVPMVTGAAEDDLAGALTYYFNSRQQVQRITFYGTTGDPDKLIRLLAARYRFGRRLTNDPSLFRYEVAEPKGPPKSHLDIRLVRPTLPAQRFDVSLLIERPAAE